jgi:hypothetical protein
LIIAFAVSDDLPPAGSREIARTFRVVGQRTGDARWKALADTVMRLAKSGVGSLEAGRTKRVPDEPPTEQAIEMFVLLCRETAGTALGLLKEYADIMADR